VVKLGAQKQDPIAADSVEDDNLDQKIPNYMKWWNSFFKYINIVMRNSVHLRFTFIKTWI
jgi:hypothetical protein